MMTRNVATLLLVVLMGAGCASAPHSVVEEDMNADWSGSAFQSLLVIGAYEDRAYRAGAETTFVETLRQKGVEASPSFDSIPQLDVFETDAELAARAAELGHDGLLIIATLDEGYDYDIGDYYATRGAVYMLGGEPGAGTDMGAFIAWAGSGIYELYVGLWDAGAMKPVWQVRTSSNSTGSESDDAKALADFVVEGLREKGLLAGVPAGS